MEETRKGRVSESRLNDSKEREVHIGILDHKV